MPDEYKVDCFIIYIIPLKNSLDDMLLRVLDNLTNALKTSLKKDCELVENFVNTALEKLKEKPTTQEEFTKHREEYS